jgi:selenocysteine-specific elongation factor
MPIVATAGHVDHGKSTLVEALTGRDPDRWAEEKARGLTIDLGFAWTEIGEFEVGFVDVPGHERFIKNMLAGVGAVDVALFVVAADEGWMPQSEEHLAILDLLDTRHGVIALTRVDIADAETADVAELGILESTEGTALSAWPIVRVSPITGTGMEELRAALAEQLTAAGEPVDSGRPRLWIDRAFTISGAGLVVTGTLSGGCLAEGDEVMLWPEAKQARIRGMQRHDAPVTSLAPGTRAALNITGVDHTGRGAMLGKPESFGTTTRFLGTLRTVRSLDEELSSRGAFHLHVGSGSWPIRLRIIETPGLATACLIRSVAPLPLRSGDRFIVRETGRRAVVGGGIVLDPRPPESGEQLRVAVPLLVDAVENGPDDTAQALLTIRGTSRIDDLVRDTGGGSPSSQFRTKDLVMAESAAAGLRDSIKEATEAFHRDNRLRPGAPKASLGSSLGADVDTLSMVVAGTPDLIDDGATIRMRGFEPGLTPAEQAAWNAAERELSAGLAVPRASQLGLDKELLHALVRDGRLVKAGEDLVYLPEQITTITELLSSFDQGFTVADFRDLIGVTRRQAVPLLEWFDKQGATVRRGDIRELRR